MVLVNKILAANYVIDPAGINPGASPASTLESLISNIIGFLSLVGIIFFVFQIIFAGYAFLSSQGDEKKLQVARDRLTNGILGITIVIIALGAGALIAFIMGIDTSTIFNLNSIINRLSP